MTLYVCSSAMLWYVVIHGLRLNPNSIVPKYPASTAPQCRSSRHILLHRSCVKSYDHSFDHSQLYIERLTPGWRQYCIDLSFLWVGSTPVSWLVICAKLLAPYCNDLVRGSCFGGGHAPPSPPQGGRAGQQDGRKRPLADQLWFMLMLGC
jgi:hypothetical protein